MQMPLLGLLIQGPLISIGRGSNNYGALGTREDEIINFNSEEAILNNLNKYSSRFIEVIISTWSDEVLTESFKKKIEEFKNVKIISFDKPPNSSFESKMYGDFLWNNNQLLQYSGCYQGLQEFYEAEFIFRIRTDQEIDVDLFVEDSLENPEKISVPAIHEANQHLCMDDFYFSGTKKKLLQFCKACSEKIYHRAPQINPLYVYGEKRYKDSIQGTGFEGYWINSIESRVVSFKVATLDLIPVSKNIYNAIIWRGEEPSEHWKNFHNYKLFKEDLPIEKSISIFSSDQYKIINFFYSRNSSIFIKLIKYLLSRFVLKLNNS